MPIVVFVLTDQVWVINSSTLRIVLVFIYGFNGNYFNSILFLFEIAIELT